MNRRDALRKLAAGGAIAAGGSMVLSSNNVAFAASASTIGSTGIVTGSVPAQNVPLPIAVTVPSSNGKEVVIGDATSPQCVGGTPTVWHGWRINSFSLQGPGGVLEIRNMSNAIITNTVSSGYSTLKTGNGTVKLTRSSGTPLKKSSYSIGVLVTWQCQGAATRLEAEYTMVGYGTDAPPAVQNISWRMV